MAGSGTASRSSHAHANGSDRVQLVQLQRARILTAMFDVVVEHGAAHVSVAHIVERSGVSRRTFYELFEDREDCFLAAFDEALAYASERVLAAYRPGGRWRERVRAGLLALLSFLDEEPVIGRVLICESLAGDRRVLERRGRAIGQLTSIVDEGRSESKGELVSPLVAEGVVGGVLAVIHARLLDPDRKPLIGLANPLMGTIVLPYLGAGAARRELERPLPDAGRTSEHNGSLLADPFKDAGMRLTYRTVRVLLAVSEHAGASNRLVGETAGISDQGQISKLLGRLQRIGLVSNAGLGPGLGAPNAWVLTNKGEQIARSVRVHTERTG